MHDLLSTFVFFFAVIDPVGTVPVFIAVTQSFEPAVRRRVALRATLTATAVLMFFVIVGELILDGIGIPLEAFQIAGGIILFLFALTMIFGEGKPSEELRLVDRAAETAIFPLAIPSIASPGAMLAAVLLTENKANNLLEQAITSGIMLSVLALVFLLLLAATRIQRWIGASGASVISRVMGLILASVAVNSVLAGIKDYFDLNPV